MSGAPPAAAEPRDHGPRLLPVSAAARMLGVSPSSLRAWAAEGRVPHLRTPGGHRRFELEELERWLADRGGAPPAPQQRQHELVPTRVERMPAAAEDLLATGEALLAAFDEELERALPGGGRSTSARRSRAVNAAQGLAAGLAAGDLGECYREAEWEGFRHGASGQAGDAPVAEALALRRAVDRTLASALAGRQEERRAIERALDRIVVRVAAGYADGVRSRVRADVA